MRIEMPSYNEFWRTERLSRIAQRICNHKFDDEICSINDHKGTLIIEFMKENPHPTFQILLSIFWKDENEIGVEYLYKSKPIQNDL
jgi:hypothetical protein